MPRLRINTRRTSLLSTNLRAEFIEALGRNVSANGTRFGTRRPSDSTDLQTVARRVQTDIRQATGRYCPLNQILSSIQDLGSDNCTSPVDTLPPPTPRAVPIVITASTPPSSSTSALDSPMVHHRITRPRPTLPFHLSMPPLRAPSTSTSPLGSPCGLTPPYPIASFMRRSHSSGGNTSQPITPIDQIACTPLTPPKLPRLVPCAPGTWSRLNVQARKENLSPLETPTLPLTPHPLCPMNARKPVLGRLQIPDAPKEPGLLGAPRSAHLTPSPQALSPFDIGRGQFSFSGGLSAPEGTKHVLMPTSSSSNLTRTTLLRVSRPALAHKFSQSLDLRNAPDRAGSPPSLLSPFAGPGSTLGSPFAIRPEGEYFRV
ncbi:hypothetical protein GSI_00122 [Ganoderma sinense ZZ0214-1]|uniref:Uncharacterized protein n=1 Tax=Ganoderma sinense ZZ0214-1 TaxID=1077348 RepID=A0A2G8SRU4_9APHY|nr:hypothetical protein GSI_00122 [Ganoderma sinense ZZ0214-1]